TRFSRDWSSDVCSSDLDLFQGAYGLMMYLIETQCLSGRIYDEYVKSLQGNLDDSGQLIPSSTALGRHNTPFRGVNLGIPHGVARSEERRVGNEGCVDLA